MLVGDFNSPLKTIQRSSKQKINKELQALNDMLDQLNLIYIYRIFHPKIVGLTFFLKCTWNILQDRSHLERDTCTPVFIAAWLTVARTQKQLRCPSTDEWIKKFCYIYTIEYYSAIKRIAFESVLVRWMNPEPVIQCEISQTWKNKYCILTCVWKSRKMILMNVFAG